MSRSDVVTEVEYDNGNVTAFGSASLESIKHHLRSRGFELPPSVCKLTFAGGVKMDALTSKRPVVQSVVTTTIVPPGWATIIAKIPYSWMWEISQDGDYWLLVILTRGIRIPAHEAHFYHDDTENLEIWIDQLITDWKCERKP